MALASQDVVKKQLARGIDSYSARSSLLDGYAEDILNADAISSGQLKKRKGYEGYRGRLPLRVKTMYHAAEYIYLTFDDSQAIDLSGIGSCPIVVQGRLNVLDGPDNVSYTDGYYRGDFGATNTVRYYNAFEVSNRNGVAVGTNIYTFDADTTGIASKYAFIGLGMASGASTTSNTTLGIASIKVHDTTFETQLEFDSAESGTSFFYYLDKAAEAGVTHIETVAAQTSVSITAATHGLSNYNIGVRCFDTSVEANYLTEVMPTLVSISSTGTVAVTFDTAFTGYIICTACPILNVASTTVTGGATESLSISVSQPFNFFYCYAQVGSTYESVIPSSITYDENTSTASIEFVAPPSAETIFIYHEEADSVANRIKLTDTHVYTFTADASTDVCTAASHEFVATAPVRLTTTGTLPAGLSTGTTYYVRDVSGDTFKLESSVGGGAINITSAGSGTHTISIYEGYTGTHPQLTVWGIPHEGIYKDSSLKGGWVQHIDNYKSATDEFLVAGIGGSFYKELSQADGESSYLIPTSTIQLRGRVDNGPITIAPLFGGTGRTRGVITDASISSYKATVTAASYVSSGVVDYTLSFTNKTGTISTSIATGFDKLTVSNMPHAALNGSFVISSVQSESTTAAVIRCVNSSVLNTTLDTAGCAGLAGVFTDLITLEETHRFIPGDIIRSTGINSSYTVTVVGGTTTNLYVSGITGIITLPDGLAIYGRRTGSILPVQNSANVFSSDNFVRGDMLQVGSLSYYPRIEQINVNADTTLASLSGDGTTATATTSAANTYAVGDKILIYNSANFAGEHEITGITSDTVFTFAHSYSGSGSGTIQGYTLQIDSEITFNDYLAPDDVTVVGRWVPIENPANSGSYVYDSTAVPQYPITTAYHWTANAYDNQPVVRSAMVADNMYVTNGYDEVMKIDGSNIYRAGLPAWQPQLFTQVDTATASLLKGYTISYSAVSVAAKYFRTATAAFKAGDRVYDATSGSIFTVADVVVVPGATDVYNIVVAEDTTSIATGGTDTLTLVKTYAYYARLNMIDANDNIIASAATGYNDCIVELVADGQIHHKLVMPPAFGAYDYDRIEVELYRSLVELGKPIGFYLVKRVTANFDNYSGYIEIDDGTPDAYLIDSDVVHGIIKAGELGVNFEAPPRAKHITSAANRLILGNIKSYPQIDITMRPVTTSLTATDLDGFSLLFRQDNTSSTSTTTEYNDAIKFIFRNSSAVTIDPTADFSCTSTSFTIKEDAHGLAVGDWVYLFHSAEGTNNDLKYAGWYRVNAVDTAASPDTFTCLRNETLSTFTFTADAGTDVITATAHGLSNGDIITVASSTTLPAGLTAATNYYVRDKTADTFKVETTVGGGAVDITDAGTGTHTATICLLTPANHVNRYVTCTSGQNEKNIPVWLGTDGNYNQKDGNTTGSIEYTAALRLSNAINAISRNKYSIEHTEGDTASAYAQWMLARGGNDKALGQLTVETARVLATTPEVVVGTVPSNLEIYINNIKRESSEQVSAVTYVHPSRVVISYENYPEIFEAVNATASDSDSVVDINAADGQEVMGLIPFFGDSTFGQGSLDQVVVVFKENSIYLLDVVSKDYKKIDSRGLGCSAPNSIAPSKNGIIFANKAGIYRLNRDMSISPVGKMMDGYWKDDVTLDSLTNAYATNYSFNSQYKLSLPVNSESSNSEVYVYNYDTEGQGQEYGAWTRYDNHPTTGWANKSDTAFMATTGGDVMYVKTVEENEAYRDDATAISTSITLKAEDFDIPASRKVIRSLSTQLAYPDNCTGLSVSTAVNLSSSFESAGSITDTTGEDLNIQASPAKRKCNYIQAKYTHSTIDEGFTISGVSYDVARLDTRGSTKMADRG